MKRNLIFMLALFLASGSWLLAPQAHCAATDPAFKVQVSNQLISIHAKDASAAEVFKELQEKTGVEIKVYEGVEGQVSINLEDAPIEKVIDRILSSIGQKNYVMAQEDGEARKIWILPKGKDIQDADAKGRMKVKGTLRNGKEIEYYPGEIIVGLKRNNYSMEDLNGHVRTLEVNHDLTLIDINKVGVTHVIFFRLDNYSEPISAMYEIINHNHDFVAFVVPNGLGGCNIEMPQENFHQWNTSFLQENIINIRERYPFLRVGKIYKDEEVSSKYVQGEFRVNVYKEDSEIINYDFLLGLTHDEGGIIINRHIDGYSGETNYTLLFPNAIDDGSYSAILYSLRETISAIKKNPFTNVFSHAWLVPNGMPDDQYYNP